MKIWKNLFGKDDKIHVDEIAVSPGLLLGGAVVVDSGETNDGYYTRFGDGTQICQLIVIETTSITSPSGVLYVSDLISWYYPKTFMDYPSISIVGNSCWGLTSSLTVSRVDFRLVATTSRTVPFYTLMAIGRWK